MSSDKRPGDPDVPRSNPETERHSLTAFAGVGLEARVGERTRIARELHDTLLQSFHGVLLQLEVLSQVLRERPMEAQQRLESTIDLFAEAITEGRDAVQGLGVSGIFGGLRARMDGRRPQEFEFARRRRS